MTEIATPTIDSVEPDVIRHLGDALAGLARANQSARCGIVSDHCISALREIQKALRGAGGNENVQPESEYDHSAGLTQKQYDAQQGQHEWYAGLNGRNSANLPCPDAASAAPSDKPARGQEPESQVDYVLETLLARAAACLAHLRAITWGEGMASYVINDGGVCLAVHISVKGVRYWQDHPHNPCARPVND